MYAPLVHSQRPAAGGRRPEPQSAKGAAWEFFPEPSTTGGDVFSAHGAHSPLERAPHHWDPRHRSDSPVGYEEEEDEGMYAGYDVSGPFRDSITLEAFNGRIPNDGDTVVIVAAVNGAPGIVLSWVDYDPGNDIVRSAADTDSMNSSLLSVPDAEMTMTDEDWEGIDDYFAETPSEAVDTVPAVARSDHPVSTSAAHHHTVAHPPRTRDEPMAVVSVKPIEAAPVDADGPKLFRLHSPTKPLAAEVPVPQVPMRPDSPTPAPQTAPAPIRFHAPSAAADTASEQPRPAAERRPSCSASTDDFFEDSVDSYVGATRRTTAATNDDGPRLGTNPVPHKEAAGNVFSGGVPASEFSDEDMIDSLPRASLPTPIAQTCSPLKPRTNQSNDSPLPKKKPVAASDDCVGKKASLFSGPSKAKDVENIPLSSSTSDIFSVTAHGYQPALFNSSVVPGASPLQKRKKPLETKKVVAATPQPSTNSRLNTGLRQRNAATSEAVWDHLLQDQVDYTPKLFALSKDFSMQSFAESSRPSFPAVNTSPTERATAADVLAGEAPATSDIEQDASTHRRMQYSPQKVSPAGEDLILNGGAVVVQRASSAGSGVGRRTLPTTHTATEVVRASRSPNNTTASTTPTTYSDGISPVVQWQSMSPASPHLGSSTTFKNPLDFGSEHKSDAEVASPIPAIGRFDDDEVPRGVAQRQRLQSSTTPVNPFSTDFPAVANGDYLACSSEALNLQPKSPSLVRDVEMVSVDGHPSLELGSPVPRGATLLSSSNAPPRSRPHQAQAPPMRSLTPRVSPATTKKGKCCTIS